MQTPRQGLRSLMTMPLIGCLLMTQAYAAAPVTVALRDVAADTFKLTTTLKTVDVGGRLVLDWLTVVKDFNKNACDPVDGYCIRLDLTTLGKALEWGD